MNVNCEELPLPEIGLGEKPTDTPVGAPDAESATEELNPPVVAMVI